MAVAPEAIFSTHVLSGAHSEVQGINTEGDEDLEEWLASNFRTRASLLQPCPLRCSEAVNSTGNPSWFQLSDASSLSSCNETLLLSLIVDNDEPQGIKVCAADYDPVLPSSLFYDGEKAALCTTPNHEMAPASVRISFLPEKAQRSDSATFSSNHLLAAGRQVVHHLASRQPSCSRDAMSFGYSQSALIGVFAGVELHQHGLTFQVMQRVLQHVEDNFSLNTFVVQLCYDDDGLGADYTVGVIATSSNNLHLAHQALKTWAGGKCVETK
ncbi:hypothetical protein G3M48_002467 [Beauveria asiatica]|uniref:Uncharacterized protein n=1 Tax=Beauveria asiatica TaxID=1069075 RepID=A0AAW0RXN1_9HYPO